MSHPLFVYGTLKSGEDQAGMLGDLRRRPAKTRGTLWRLPAGYPALTMGEGVVHGELVDPPDDRMLGMLDIYEGVPEGLYRRVLVEVGPPSTLAWAYVMDAPERQGGVRIPNGRWRSARWRR